MDGLLAALRLALHVGDGRHDARTCAGITDWAAVAGLAARHRVRPLLLDGLASLGPRSVASGLNGRLSDELRVMPRVRGLRQFAALAEVDGRLAEGGIESIVLKGLPLSQRLHGNPLLRESVDIDLLVSPERFGAAEAILLGTGWRRVRPGFRETPRRKRWHDHLVKDALFVRPGGGVAIELHRRLLNNPHLFNAPFGQLREEAATQTVGARAYLVLGDRHLLPYLACHGLEHYWHRLKWLCDIAALITALDDEWLARSVAAWRRQGLGTALGSAFGLCGGTLRVAPSAALIGLAPGGARSRLIAHLARRKWEGSQPRGWRWALRSLQDNAARFALKASLRYALFELARLLVAPHEFGRPDLPDRWLWLAPLLRPAAWIVKALGRHRDRKTG
ncbi:MAG: nucleotidyltransferase family protein [Gammaproteobacteria bacterium]|nr:nucleotidyltransferase family protein [Gammaproteobacteria bacterium]